MTKNNAHLGETAEKRLERFQSNPPYEVIHTLLNSIDNHFNNEIGATFDNPQNPQTSLMILGIHSVALTVAFGLFNKGGEQGYKLFLEHFVDGDTPDTKFSTIASEIHEWRNIIAHRWLNIAGHEFGYDFDMPEGWRKEGEVTFLNPKVYLDQYLKAFVAGGRIWSSDKILTTDAMMEDAKQRFISKYVEEA